MAGPLQKERFYYWAKECGFELAGVVRAGPVESYPQFQQWVSDGKAGAMQYLADHRARLREDPRLLMPSARSVLCLGKLYKTKSIQGPISNYAWGAGDYHDTLRAGLERLAAALQAECGPFEFKICVDTAPLLERAIASAAGLGWIGKNTCLINEQTGSWYFLGELLVSLELPPDAPPPDRCGTCTACLDACPTQALTPYSLDARRCISYHTIELKGSIPEEFRAPMGGHVFGCDICQDVCPWNTRAPATTEPAFQPIDNAPALEEMTAMTAEEFRARFRRTPVWRTKHEGFLRNVAIAMGNSSEARFGSALDRLSRHESPVVAEHARWGLQRLSSS